LTRNYLLRKIGAALPSEKLVVDDQTTGDIITRMAVKHKDCRRYYDKIAEDFTGRNVLEIAQKIFDFCKGNIAYKEESLDRQNISSPQTILSRGVCDCKGYALFSGGVLDALNRKGYGINWKYRYASDKPGADIPGHVFVVIQDQGHEIWLDPVLDEFNQDHKYYYELDRKIPFQMPARVAGCGCQDAPAKIGDDVKEVGGYLLKLSPTLAAVPVVGWIGAAAGTVVGAFLSFFGDSYTTSDNVRWLTAKYQYYVLGDASATSNHHVNEKYTGDAQGWFSTVLGVPIFDQFRYHALRGTSPQTGQSLNLTRDQRAKNYLASAPDAVQLGVTYNQALAATYEADKFQENGIPAGNVVAAGAWKGFLPAKALVTGAAPGKSDVYVDPSGNLVSAPAGAGLIPGLENNKLVLIAAGAAILFILLK
jgi:hypothetical protein